MNDHYCSLLKIHLPENEDFDFLKALGKDLPNGSFTIENDCTLFFTCSLDSCQDFRKTILKSVNQYFNTSFEVEGDKRTISSGRFTLTI